MLAQRQVHAGLWSLAADGQLARLAMPLPDQNVMTVLMAWPLTPGKAYLGVAPQQGGQVVEMDLATGRLRLTEGYNGQGPDDAFAARGDFTELHPCDAGLQEIHRRRLSRRPATPPEKPL